MLLKSASTPVLGSLSSGLESPNNNNIHHHPEANTLQKHHSKPPLYKSGCLNLAATTCNCSSKSPSFGESRKGFRRVQSEGNLKALKQAPCSTINDKSKDDQHHPISCSTERKIIRRRTKSLVLDTTSSFSFVDHSGCDEDGGDEANGNSFGEEQPRETVSMHSDQVENKALIQEPQVEDRFWNPGFVQGGGENIERMYLAKGLGIGGAINGFGGGGGGGGWGGSGGRGGDFFPAGGDGGDVHETEAYYKKMVQANPSDPLFLRNYAEFLYKTKLDLKGAEEYYSRAILMDPKDGEILSQYAKLVWELHHDHDRALGYFERAVQASPEESHVHAAYASFLWETEEDEGECSLPNHIDNMPPCLHKSAMASAGY
ncbi:hypothetical protein Tsubulata_005698 [Turnera subulata]|uniref:Suppressor of forked domain-containing protein n=1 Tax=Turnera subulata TaxID=218843 RepID=A0A9Q0GM21_9ROSI|nr:hypothetical protein Tsubulata_005698 [Turnera subulata]